MRVSRTAWHDWYVDEEAGDSAVFVGGRVLAMSELATVLLDLLAEPRELGDLAAALSAVFGPPPGDAVEATATLVERLVAEGVLDTDPVGG